MLPARRYATYPPPAPGLLSTLTVTSLLNCLRRTHATPVAQVLTIELDREEDGRYIAEIPAMPGVMVYGATSDEALQKVAALAFRVFADRLESEEVQAKPDMTFQIHARECLAGR